MVTFGIDASHHQGVLDFGRFRRESGIEFAFLKATEGSSFVDDEFAVNLWQASSAGLLVAAYHYQRSNASAADQVGNILATVPSWCPVLIDVEANSGNTTLAREIVARLVAAGYRTPLLYLPRWYWQQLGSPDLRGLPPLWSSRYPDNLAGTLAAEYAQVPASYWIGYGGLTVEVLQFTSSGRLPSYADDLDLNAYRGTRAELESLLGYTHAPPTEEAEEMSVRLVKGDAADETYAVKLDPTLTTADGEPTAAVRCYVPPTIGPALLAAFGPVKVAPQQSFDSIAKVEGSR
jgi:lysozyme